MCCYVKYWQCKLVLVFRAVLDKYFSTTSSKWMLDSHEALRWRVKQPGTHLHTLLLSWHSAGRWKICVTRWLTARRLVLSRAWITVSWRYHAGTSRSSSVLTIGYFAMFVALLFFGFFYVLDLYIIVSILWFYSRAYGCLFSSSDFYSYLF